MGMVADKADDVARRMIANMVASNWQTRPTPNNRWMDIVWSPELRLLVSVAYTGLGDRVMTSPDGYAWSASASASDDNWLALAWSPSIPLFAAVAFNGIGTRLMTSPDGTTWTSRTPPNVQSWAGICWSAEKSMFVAVADNNGAGNTIMRSSNGVNWFSAASPVESYWQAVIWVKELGLFVAIGFGGNNCATSPDGNVWTLRETPSGYWQAVTWSPELGLLVAVSFSGDQRSMTSSNGINWTGHNGVPEGGWGSIAWSPELRMFVVMAFSITSTFNMMTSFDGVIWTVKRCNLSNASTEGVIWVRELGMFVAGIKESTAGDNAMYSLKAF